MAKTVVGLMDNPREAESVVRALTSECGCERADIGLMARGSQNEVTGSTGTSGALKGAGAGAAVGGVLGLVAGVAALSIPGFGPFIAAGPIASALAGATLGAAAGGVIGALTHLGVPEDEAHYYAEGVRRGGTLVTVHAKTDDRAQCAAEVMRKRGAADIEQRAAEWKKQGWGGRVTAGEEVIPVTQEAREQKVRGKVKKTDVKVERGAGARYTGPERRVKPLGSYTGAERRLASA